MRQRRAYRWALFVVAAVCFMRFVFFDHASWATLALFFLSGGLWYGLERRKVRELDASVSRRGGVES
ncbi:MAG: hypothetical protein WC969_10760 [Elusimicrobiota bacterium]